MASILQLLKRITGENIFLRLRSAGYRILHTIHPPFSRSELKAFLGDELGIKEGDTLFVHSSMDKLNIRFPADQLIPLLQELVGPEGTLAFPCWHFQERAEEYLSNPDNVFDVKRSPSVMGLLTEFARRNKQATRSLHPTSSVVAIGRHARELTEEHHLSEYPCGQLSPFYKIMHYGGKILGLGEKPETSLSFVHCAEDAADGSFPVKTRTDRVFTGHVIDQQGKKREVKTRAAHKNIQHRDIRGFFKKHISNKECRLTRKRGTWFYIAHAVPLYEKMKTLALQGKTIYTLPLQGERQAPERQA